MEKHDGFSHSDSDEWVKVDEMQAPCAEWEEVVNQRLPSYENISAVVKHPDRSRHGVESDSAESRMQFQLRLHREAVALREPCNVLGMVSLKAPAIGSTPRLARLDIVAVVDRSGSMSGLRINLVRKALSFICKQLRPGDRLALVSYSDHATVDMPLTLMDGEGQLQCSLVLETLSAGGATNLGEGLLWGLGELASSDAPAAAMLLFTDGLANRGMTNTENLVEAMKDPVADMGRQSRAVFAFGLGTDHNAQMLFSLADAGTGCYYYIDTAQAIAPSFADCLGGMLSVAAQDVTVVLCTKEGVKIHDVHADFNCDFSEDRTEARIKMRDLSSDAEKEVLFTLLVPASQANSETFSLIACTVSYVDVIDGFPKTQDCVLTIRVLKEGEAQVDADAMVELHLCRLLAARALEQSAAMLANGNVHETRAALSEALEKLESSPARMSTESGSQERIAALIADLSECLERTSDPRSCEKLCSSRAFAHKHQISTRAEGLEYRNELQRSLAEAARREIGTSIDQTTPCVQPPGRRRSNRFQPGSRRVSKANTTVASDVGNIPAGAVRTGMRIMCRGQAGIVQEVTSSKTGKHGHAKVFFTVLGDDGIKRQDVVPASNDVELADEAATRASAIP